ncbi:unnamed protein product [Rhizophagus irregularis]|nr:unnamed protein product [Rhizophagus irregularis]
MIKKGDIKEQEKCLREKELKLEFVQMQEQRERTLKGEVHRLLNLVGNTSDLTKLYMNEIEINYVEQMASPELEDNKTNEDKNYYHARGISDLAESISESLEDEMGIL